MAARRVLTSARQRNNRRMPGSSGGSVERAIDRRAFLVKAAATTLFGAVGLEAVVDAVLNRLQDIESTRKIARAIASQLERDGLSGRAMADLTDSYVCPNAS